MVDVNRGSMRIKVLSGKKELSIESHQNQNLLAMLQENNISVSNSCHGIGTCGKCKIKVVEGYLPVTEADKRSLTENELEQGIRLACKAKIDKESEEQEELWIEIVGALEEDMVVEAMSKKKLREDFQDTNYFIAIDIGTTTIAMALISEETGEIVDVYTSVNHQRKYGADVISRIVAANDGKAEELKKLIEEDLWKGIKSLLPEGIRSECSKENDVVTKVITNECDTKKRKTNLNRIIISGNTTMIHLLMGYSCESLGKYPFISEHLEKIECKWNNTPVTILPGISAFVGGDIVAGILACPKFETEELSLLIDLGTNGEMVLGNSDRLLTASAAAGPAFEGGNIICGTAAVPGSICQVKIQNQRAVVRTIKNEMPPIGICGSGLISIMAQLKANRLIKLDGELMIPYNEKGFPLWIFENGEKIALYQKDIREFQMAKAAVRAGIDILMEEYGCTPEEIENVYVAGGFGKAIDIKDMMTIGMLPDEFEDKISIVGNSALQGAVCFGKDRETRKQIENICRRAENITLSEKTEFQKKYLKYMKL